MRYLYCLSYLCFILVLTILLLRKLSVRLTFFSVSLLDVGMNFSFSSSSDLLHHILGIWK